MYWTGLVMRTDEIGDEKTWSYQATSQQYCSAPTRQVILARTHVFFPFDYLLGERGATKIN